MRVCCPNREVRIVFYIGTFITLIHINLLLFLHVRYFTSDDFVKSFRWYRYQDQALCVTPPDLLKDQLELTSSTMRALEGLSVSAAVCYGTLWGVLRTGSLLPWDRAIDFCVMSQELQNVSFSDLERIFHQEGVHITDFDWRHGSYGIAKGNAHGEINVFFDCTTLIYFTHPELRYTHIYPPDIINPPSAVSGWACAKGWNPMVASLVHGLRLPFPKMLLEPPFSSLSVGDVNVNVPQDGIEIQKYSYPDDWWLEVKPPSC